MKRRIIILLLSVISLSVLAGKHTYTGTSVLSSGKWVKIRVSESGVCRMSFSELESAGITPSQVRVFGYGGAQLAQDFQQTKIDDLPQVPVYVGTDYILFWAQGPVCWEYNGTRFVHTRNTYSDYGYYFLTDNVGELLAPAAASAVTGTPTDVTTYAFYQVHNKDSLNLIDRTGVAGGGRTFYGEQFVPNRKRTFTFATPNAVTTESSAVRVAAAAYASEPSEFHVSLNNSAETSMTHQKAKDQYAFGEANSLTLSAPSRAAQQQVQLRFTNYTVAGAYGWLDFIEITTPSTLRMTGTYMPVRTTVNYKTNYPVRFHLSGAKESIQVWDITDLSAIRRMPTSYTSGELTWTGTQADGVHEYVAVDPSGSTWVHAEVVGTVANQNLHALKNIDYVIICPEGYEQVSEDLAKAHEAKQAVTWAVVTDQQVYNEFSSGTPDATAYRWLMKMLYDRADGNSIAGPRWLLLMGHGTFDNRKLLVNSGSSLLLTYQARNSENEVNAYMSDDYFGFLDDSEGESDTMGRLDIGVGRLPVESVEEARTTVDKLIAYMRNERTGKWKNQLVYLADDGEHGTHTKTAEESAERVRLKNPDFIVHKIYLDAYPQEVSASGESYPLARNRLANLLKNGALYFNFAGHGSYHSITNESMLNQKDIENMSNANQAFWLFATCNFAQCDAGKRSAAESALLNPNGGAIGVFSATRTAYATPNTELNRAVTDTLFGYSDVFHYGTTLGEAIMAGKNKLGSDANKLTYVLLGDPALRLNYPTDYQVQTLTAIDTLNALSVQHMKGRIIDEDSALVSDFNGTVDITIYDKLQVITTRDNDSKKDEEVELQYNDYPSTIFTGSTEVKGGTFEYTFMVPKDIRYNFGNGRIVYYAVTTGEGETAEAVGHFEQFIIGGTSSVVLADTTGPDMHIYLNNKEFQSGGKTYATPRFYADLYDENGINTAGAGIGHDLMLIIDNDPKMIFSLNEYFTSSNDSYREGQVSYLMENLSNGPHSLTFRAWDLLNNSTTQSLNFIVEAGIDPSIYSVATYPNPVQASGILNMVVNYDQPDELIESELCIANLNGQILWTHTQNNPDAVTVNIAELGMQPGIYMYTIRIKSADSRYSSSSGKIIITQ